MFPLVTRHGSTARARLPLILRSLFLVSALAVLPTLSAGAGAASRAGTGLHLPRSPLSGGVLAAQAVHAGQVAPSGAAAALSAAPGALTCSPTPCALPNVQASEGGKAVDETPIAANPVNALDLLTGGNDFNCASVLGFDASSDGGATWSHTCMVTPPSFSVGCGDPGVGYDLAGAAYIIGIDSSSTSCFPSVISFEKSTNNGTSWSAPAVAVPSLFPGGLTDKPWLQVDDNAASPHAGAVYISVTQFDSTGNDTQISVSHSTDGGTTWATSAVETAQVFPVTDQFSDLVIGKDGTVYVSWMRCTGTECAGTRATLLLAKSTDGGNTWSAPVTIATATLAPDPIGCCFYGQLPDPSFPAGDTAERVSEIPVIGIDNSGGPHAGNLYAAFYTWTGSAMKVEVATSLNGGTTWGAPVPLAPPADPNDEFFPWLSVSSGGLVGVTWLDRRYDPQDRLYEAFAAISSDGGLTFPNLLIASAASSPKNDGFNGTFMGDYTGNVWNSSGTTLYTSWMDSRNGVTTQDEVGGRIGTGSVPAWNIVPNPKVSPTSTLRAMAAVSSADVWAVGFFQATGGTRALTEQWNGTSWTVVPSPAAVGTSLSGPNGVAAGSRRTPTPTPSPTPSSSFSALNGVAAISASDIWTVGNAGISGSTDLTLTEHWNGSSWSVVPSPNAGTSFNTLLAVAADSTSDVWAVGSFQTTSGTQTLIEQWNGTAWTVIPSPNVGTGSNQLNGVVAISPTNAWAVGFGGNAGGQEQTLVEQWNGTTWSVVSSPNVGTFANELDAVATVSASDIWAVGSAANSTQTLVEQWDGTRWSVVPSPNGNSAAGSSNDLAALSVVSAGDVWAAGFTTDSFGNLVTLTEQWNGTTWTVVPSLVFQGSAQSRFLGLAAITASNVWGVGITALTEQYCC
jgi:hypothetical protein